MSAECRDWMEEIEQQLKPHKIEFASVADADITKMYWDNLTPKQAVEQIIKQTS